MQDVRRKHDIAAAFHVGVRAVTKAVTEFNDTGTATDRQRPGQPRVTSRWQDAFAVLRSNQNRFGGRSD